MKRCTLIAVGACALAFSGTAAAQETRQPETEQQPEAEPMPPTEAMPPTETEEELERRREMERQGLEERQEAEGQQLEQQREELETRQEELERQQELERQELETRQEELERQQAELERQRELERREEAREAEEEELGVEPLATGLGIGLSIGGGARGYTDGDTQDFVDTGGGWDGRILLGTQSTIAFEAAYVGARNKINAVGLDPAAQLMSHGAEGTLRLNFLTTAVQPYAFAGGGWSRYTLSNEDFNTSAIEDEDDVWQIPVGAGLAYRTGGFIADLRGTYRPTFSDEIIGGGGDLSNWGANITAGVEF